MTGSPEMVVACAREVVRKRAAMVRAYGGHRQIGPEAVAFGEALDQLDSVVAEYEATLAAPTTGLGRDA